MPEDLSREEEQRGTRRIFMWSAGIAIALAVVLLVVFFLWPMAMGA